MLETSADMTSAHCRGNPDSIGKASSREIEMRGCCVVWRRACEAGSWSAQQA